jgi:hypothetical protein
VDLPCLVRNPAKILRSPSFRTPGNETRKMSRESLDEA